MLSRGHPQRGASTPPLRHRGGYSACRSTRSSTSGSEASAGARATASPFPRYRRMVRRTACTEARSGCGRGTVADAGAATHSLASSARIRQRERSLGAPPPNSSGAGRPAVVCTARPRGSAAVDVAPARVIVALGAYWRVIEPLAMGTRGIPPCRRTISDRWDSRPPRDSTQSRFPLRGLRSQRREACHWHFPPD